MSHPILASMGARASGGGAPSLADLSPHVWVRGSGITAASGDVASITDEGSLGLTFEAASAGQRPEVVTVGSLTGWQFDGTEYLRSTAAADFSLPFVASVVYRVDSLTANDRIFNIGTYSYLASVSTDELRMEHAGGDLYALTTVAVNDIVGVICHWAPTGETSGLYVDSASPEVTRAGNNTIEPGSLAIGLGATNAGVAPAACTILDFAVFDGITSGTFDFAALAAYQAAMVALASV